jgi:hypothetical protein
MRNGSPIATRLTKKGHGGCFQRMSSKAASCSDGCRTFTNEERRPVLHLRRYWRAHVRAYKSCFSFQSLAAAAPAARIINPIPITGNVGCALFLIRRGNFRPGIDRYSRDQVCLKYLQTSNNLRPVIGQRSSVPQGTTIGSMTSRRKSEPLLWLAAAAFWIVS